MKVNRLILLFLLSYCCLQSSNMVFAQHLNLDKQKRAIEGYDPVAYQTLKKAVQGKASISTTYAGAVYWFENTRHKALFEANPSKYAPVYGGWCAYAMGDKGEKVEIDPETFKVIDGKTYLFYNKYFTNTLDSWNKNETSLKKQADMYWQQLLQKKSTK